MLVTLAYLEKRKPKWKSASKLWENSARKLKLVKSLLLIVLVGMSWLRISKTLKLVITLRDPRKRI